MGNQEAFRELINRYSNLLYKIVFGIVRNQKDAEDLTQEAFIQIYQSLSSYQNQGFKTWMVRIASNKAIDFKRKQLRNKEELTDQIEEGIDLNIELTPDNQALKREKKEIVHKKLDTVPENYRDMIFAHYILEKSYKEIAVEHGVEVKTVEMKLYRARKWMQKHWREEEFR
jgi:RNA polymerase sigma factor (sigma-70 family)